MFGAGLGKGLRCEMSLISKDGTYFNGETGNGVFYEGGTE